MLNQQLYSLVYTSQCSPELSEIELIRILHQASSGNARVGVTGVLVHKQGQFMQLLEGSRYSLIEIFEKIRRDRRHFLVNEVCLDKQEVRISDSFMAYRHAASDMPERYREFFEPTYDFKSVADHTSMVYDFFRHVAKPAPNNKKSSIWIIKTCC